MFQPALRLGAALLPSPGALPVLQGASSRRPSGRLGLVSRYLPSSVGRGQGSSTPPDARAAPTTRLQRRAPLGSTPASHTGDAATEPAGVAVTTPLAPHTSSRLLGARSEGAGEELTTATPRGRVCTEDHVRTAGVRGASAHGHVLLPRPGGSVPAV